MDESVSGYNGDDKKEEEENPKSILSSDMIHFKMLQIFLRKKKV